MDNIIALQAMVDHIDSSDQPYEELRCAMLAVFVMLKSLSPAQISDALQDAFLVSQADIVLDSDVRAEIGSHSKSKGISLN